MVTHLIINGEKQKQSGKSKRRDEVESGKN